MPNTKLQSLWEEWAPLPIDAFSNVQNLFHLQDSLSNFLHKYRSEFSEKEWQEFKSLIVSNKNIFDEVKQHAGWDENVE